MSKENIYAAPLSELENPENNHEESDLATRWERLGGSIVDSVISMVFTLPVMFATGFWDKAMSQTITIFETASMGVYGFAVFMLIHGYWLAKNGQTVGKKLLGTKIVSVHSNKVLPLSKVLLFRYLPITVVANIPLVGSFLVTLDSLLIFRKSKQCIHDQIAGTRVIKNNPL